MPAKSGDKMDGLFWVDQSNGMPCYPKVNELRDYICRSRIDGIWQAYNRACIEVGEIHNAQRDKIAELEEQISKLEQTAKATNTAIADDVLQKSLPGSCSCDEIVIQKKAFKPMAGRKPKLLTEEEVAKAVRMRKAGISYQNIASEFGVSERTVRRAAAADPDPVK